MIRPVHRSKWSRGNYHNHNNHQQQPRRLPLPPVVRQRPSQADSSAPNMDVDNPQRVDPGTSSISPRDRSPELGQSGIPSPRHTGISALPAQTMESSQNLDQRARFPVVEPVSVTTDFGLSNQASLPTLSNDQAPSMENRMDARPEADSPTISPSLQDKESISPSKSPSETTLGDKDHDNSGRVTPSSKSGEGSTYSSLNHAPIASPSTPIEPRSPTEEAAEANLSNSLLLATADSRGAPESHERDATPEKIDASRSNSYNDGNRGRDDGRSGSITPTPSDLNHSQSFTPKAAETSPIVSTKSIEEHTKPVGMNAHARMSSIFTDEEIKERKQAWNRIPMPLDPRKSKKLGTTVICGPQPMLPTRGEASDNTTEKTVASATCVGEQIQPESPTISSANETKPEGSAEGAELSTMDAIQQPGRDESTSAEQTSAWPSLGLSTAKRTNEGDSYASTTKLFEPSQMASGQVAELVGTTSQVPPSIDDNKADQGANNQSKAKGKWNKSKKGKKRLGSESQNTQQKDGGHQEMSQSVSEMSAILPREEPQMDHHMPTRTLPSFEPPLPSVYLPTPLQESSSEGSRNLKEQTLTGIRTQYHYDTLPRGRPDFGNNAGGSLKIPKKRKTKYPTITSRTFEASATNKFETSPIGCATNG